MSGPLNAGGIVGGSGAPVQGVLEKRAYAGMLTVATGVMSGPMDGHVQFAAVMNAGTEE